MVRLLFHTLLAALLSVAMVVCPYVCTGVESAGRATALLHSADEGCCCERCTAQHSLASKAGDRSAPLRNPPCCAKCVWLGAPTKQTNERLSDQIPLAIFSIVAGEPTAPALAWQATLPFPTGNPPPRLTGREMRNVLASLLL